MSCEYFVFRRKTLLQTRMGTQAEQGNFSFSPQDPEHMLLRRYWPLSVLLIKDLSKRKRKHVIFGK
jgi:hypothetical protein